MLDTNHSLHHITGITRDAKPDNENASQWVFDEGYDVTYKRIRLYVANPLQGQGQAWGSEETQKAFVNLKTRPGAKTKGRIKINHMFSTEHTGKHSLIAKNTRPTVCVSFTRNIFGKMQKPKIGCANIFIRENVLTEDQLTLQERLAINTLGKHYKAPYTNLKPGKRLINTFNHAFDIVCADFLQRDHIPCIGINRQGNTEVVVGKKKTVSCPFHRTLRDVRDLANMSVLLHTLYPDAYPEVPEEDLCNIADRFTRYKEELR